MFSSRNYEEVGLLVVELAIMGARKIFGVFYSGQLFMSNKEDESAATKTEIIFKFMLYISKSPAGMRCL